MRFSALIFLTCLLFSQVELVKAQKFPRDQKAEAVWDQGAPICPDDPYITGLISKLSADCLSENKKRFSKEEAKTLREIGVAFYNKGMYTEADWYLNKVRGYVEVVELDPEVVFEQPKPEEPALSESDLASIEADKAFLKNLPKSYDNMDPSNMQKLAEQIEGQIQKLIREKEQLLKSNASKELIEEKEKSISSLGKEKEIIDLSIKKENLVVETKNLKYDKETLKKYLISSIIGLAILILVIIALSQRKTIRVKDTEILKQIGDINRKNTYLEHAARIIRHDMHSGINTYMPRGISSLEKRISPEDAGRLKIETSIKMIKEGLSHTQKVYKGVYEFTNLVKQNVVLNKEKSNLKEVIINNLESTSYSKQVEVSELCEAEVNQTLFFIAIDNLIKNGLKYNDNKEKLVKIYLEGNDLIVEDNGRGLSQKEFNKYTFSDPTSIEKINSEESGLGLSISLAILSEHGFSMKVDKVSEGTKIKIRLDKND